MSFSSIRFFILISLALIFSSPAFAESRNHCRVDESVNSKARQFMSRHGMIKPNEETENFGVKSTWTLVRAELIQGRCALLMDLCITMYGETHCEGQAYEALGYRRSGRVTFFQNLFPALRPLRVAIGDRLDSNYYVQLKGSSAVSAWKTILFKIPYSGLMAEISAKNIQTVDGALYGEPDGKVYFDPTPGRTWKLQNATWSLRRGLTIEILDVYPFQLDEDFKSFYSGSGGKVGPWASYINRYYSWKSRRWVNTGVPLPSSPQ